MPYANTMRIVCRQRRRCHLFRKTVITHPTSYVAGVRVSARVVSENTVQKPHSSVHAHTRAQTNARDVFGRWGEEPGGVDPELMTRRCQLPNVTRCARTTIPHTHIPNRQPPTQIHTNTHTHTQTNHSRTYTSIHARHGNKRKTNSIWEQRPLMQT